MRVGIFGSGITASSTSHLNEMLDESGIEHFNLNSKTKSKKADCILVMGGDKGVRNYFHRTFDASIPVLGINESESDGFLPGYAYWPLIKIYFQIKDWKGHQLLLSKLPKISY